MTFRIIAQLDVKPPNLVKGIQLEGLKPLGEPHDYALRYYRDGVDELIYQDVVASLHGRSGIHDLISSTTREVFVPLTAGGGIRSVEDALIMLKLGADRVALNTAAVEEPSLIDRLVQTLGSQGVVVRIEAKKESTGWRCFTYAGREPTPRTAIDWAREIESRGAGEIVVTSIDYEGTMSGFDFGLIEAVCSAVTVPVVAHGGCRHASDGIRAHEAGASGIAIGKALHLNLTRIEWIKRELSAAGIEVRP